MALRDFTVDFSPISEIPGLIKSAREDAEIKKTLANLDSSDAKSLRAKGTELFRTGTTKAMELGLRLHQTALAREQLAQKTAQDSLYSQTSPLLQSIILGRQNQNRPAGEGGNIPEGATFDAFGGGPPAPTGPAFPNVPTDKTLLPPGPRTQAPAPEQIAQAPMPPPMAMAGQQPNAGPEQFGQSQPAKPPSWMQPETLQPGIESPIPPTPRPPQQGAVPAVGSETRIRELAAALTGIHPKNAAGRESVKALLNAEIAKTSWSPEMKLYQLDMIDRGSRGEPRVSIRDWRTEEKVQPKIFEGALEAANKRYDARDQAGGIINTVEMMKTIETHPDFIGGPLSPGWAQFGSALGGMKELLISFGVNEKSLPDISRITTQAGLIQTYEALSSRIVFESLGGKLGAQISDSDRKFVQSIFPVLNQSKEGRALMHEISAEFAKRAAQGGDVTEKYMSERGVRASRNGLEAALRVHSETNPMFKDKDGKLTEFGQRLNSIINNPSGRSAGPEVPTRSSPLRVKSGQIFYDAKGGLYRMGDDGSPISIGTGEE